MITNDPKNIVVADDSLFFRIKLSDILTEAGHGVMLVKDGDDCIARIKEDAGKIDLLILDLQMPHIDGFGVLKWIGENGFRDRFPVLAITGVYEPNHVLESLKNLGATGFMSKDLSPEQIIFRVNRLLFVDKRASRTLSERVPISIPVDFTYGEDTKSGVIINLSEGGAFLHTKEELIKGAVIHLMFSLPQRPKVVRITGIVRWFPFELLSKIIFCGYGIMFTSVEQEDQEALNDFIAAELVKMERTIDH